VGATGRERKERLFQQKGVQQLEVQVGSRCSVKPKLLRDTQKRKIHVGLSHFPPKALFLNENFGLSCDLFWVVAASFELRAMGKTKFCFLLFFLPHWVSRFSFIFCQYFAVFGVLFVLLFFLFLVVFWCLIVKLKYCRQNPRLVNLGLGIEMQLKVSDCVPGCSLD